MIHTKCMIYCIFLTMYFFITGCTQGQRPITNNNITQEINVAMKQINTDMEVKFDNINSKVEQLSNNINLELISLKTDIRKNNDVIQFCCENRRESNDIDTVRKMVDLHINLLQYKIDVIAKELSDCKQQKSNRDKTDTAPDHIGLMSLIVSISTGLAGFVILIGGLGLAWNFYRSLVDSKKIFRQTKKKLEEKFNPWLEKRKKECDKQTQEMFEKQESDMIQYGSFILLKGLIRKPGKPTEEDIYPLLTGLTSQPKFGYRALFKEIKDLDISKAVNDKIEEGTKKLDEGKQSDNNTHS
jgi:hypothetical protein